MNPLTDFSQAVEVQEKPDKSGLVAPAQKNPVLDFKDAVDPEAHKEPNFQFSGISTFKEKPIYQRIMDGIVKGPAEDRIRRSSNIDHIAKTTELSHDEVEKHYDQFMKFHDLGAESTRARAGIAEHAPGVLTAAHDILNESMPALIGIGAITHPLKTAAGVLGFTALDHIVDDFAAKHPRIAALSPLGAVATLKTHMPADAGDNFKSAVGLADFILKGGALEPLIEKTPSGPSILKAPKFLSKYLSQKAKETGIPDVVTLSADKLSALKQKLSPEKYQDFLNRMGLSPAHDDAAGEGVDLQIPTEKLFESMIKDIARQKDVSNLSSEIPSENRKGIKFDPNDRQLEPGEGPPLEIVGPVILGPTTGKEYTGADHGAAIEAARAAGEDMSEVDRERDGLFKLSDGSIIDRKEADKRFGIDHTNEIPKKTPIRQSISTARAIDRGSIFGVIKSLGGFSIGEDLAGELGEGEQGRINKQRLFGVFRKDARGIDEVLAEAKELAPGMFNRFETGSQLLDYFKNRKAGSEGEFQSIKVYEKERNEEYDREIKDLTERAIEAGISPDDIRSLIESRTQAGEVESNQEIVSGVIPEELKDADSSFDFGANLEKEKQAIIPRTESKMPEEGIKPTDKNLIQESGELFDPDKKYSVASVFYSALERAIDQKMPGSAPVSQVKGIIESSGIPKDQLDWVDIESFLKDKEKVKKEDLLNYIRQNDVKVEEVVKAEKRDNLGLEEQAKLRVLESLNNMGLLETAEQQAEFLKLSEKSGNQGPTKFSQYQLPGGENYKELLLTLPTDKEYPVRAWSDFQQKMIDKYGPDWRTAKLTPEETAQKIELVKDRNPNGVFKSSHFEEPNVLAHIRFNDRTDTEGKKVLFLEEVQSDWHQKGKKGGYKKEWEALDKRRLELENSGLEAKQKGQEFSSELKQEWADIKNKMKGMSPVPDAPFKKTESWAGLAMKRMLRYAAENGYDKIAWTTGEQQAERYDLSKQVDAVLPSRNEDGTYDLDVLKNKDAVSVQKKVAESDLDKYVGKDIARQIVEAKLNPGEDMEITGENLKVGGEGMKGFYDQILPSFLNKYTKKWGGRVMTSDIVPNPGEPAFARVHSLEITDPMKMSVLYEGQKYSVGQPFNVAQQLHVIEQGRALFEKLGHKTNQLVIEANLRTKEGERALGYFIKYMLDKKIRGITKVDPAAPLATHFHELGHGIFGLAHTAEEQRAILDEVKEHWGAVDDIKAEEMIMDQAKNAYDWVQSGKDLEEFLNSKKERTYTDKVKGFLRKFVANIKSFLGFGEEEFNMKKLKQFYEDLYSGNRKEVTAEDKEMYARYQKASDPEVKRQILESLPYFDEIKDILSDRESPSSSVVRESFRDSPAQPLGSQIKRAGVALKNGVSEVTKAVDKIFNPATSATKSSGKEAYSSVIRAIHTPDAEAIGFDNARSNIMDMNFSELEKFFNRLSKKDLNNFNLTRGEATDPNAQFLQALANEELPKSIRDKNLIGAVKEASDYVYGYLLANGIDVNYFEDYFYGAYKDQNKVTAFLDHWQHTERFTKEKQFPTIADAQAFGLELKDPNPITNIRAEMKAAALKVGLKQLREEQLKNGHNYATESLTASPEQVRQWRKIHESTFRGMIFDKDYADFVNSLLSTNKISSNLFLSGIRRTAQIAQQVKFAGSLFHLRNVTKAAISDETMGMFDKEGYKNVIKSFKPIDEKLPEYKNYVNLGGGHKYSIESQAQKNIQEAVEKMAGGGLIWKGIGKVTEASKWIPASPKMIEWMFDKYIPAIKFNRYLQELEVQKDRAGRELTDFEKINIVRTNQNFYGEMNERLFGRSGTVTSAMRFIFSAPGYAEGNFRAVFQSVGDIGRKATGKEISEQGQRNAQFIASSLFTTLTLATVTSLALTGQLPPIPKTPNDVRDLFKARTGLKDGNGDDVFIDMMGYDNDFYAIYGNLATGQPGKIPPALTKRVTGLPSAMFRTMNDITTIFNGGKVYDFRGMPIYYETDDLGEKMGKFMEYESTQAGAISLSSLVDAQRKGLGLAASVGGAVAGVRTVTSESVKETKKARTDIFTLEDSKRGKTIDLNKLYKENPDKAREEAKVFNDKQIKKVLQILKKEAVTEQPPRKFFEQFIIKSLHGAGEIEGTTLESLFKKPKRKSDKIVSREDDEKINEFVKEHFNS